MSYNPGLLYYKHYYEGIRFDAAFAEPGIRARLEKDNEKAFARQNKILTDTRFPASLLPPLDQLAFPSFTLTTSYPGLVIGTGYTHGSGLMGEFKTGFYFDHTTGLPVIPGSGVKGLLRSTFPGMYREKAEQCNRQSKADDAAFWNKLAGNRQKFIEALLKTLNYPADDGRPDFIYRLEREIFEGLHGTNREKKEDHFPMRYRDIFFDAVIIRSADGLVFADDYITPHKKPLKNPIPIQILKVRPGVSFTFQFRLHEHFTTGGENNPEQQRLLTAAQRLELFRQILLFLGAGAKTSVGFGHFEAERRVDLSGGGQGSGQTTKEVRPPVTASAPILKPFTYDKKLVGKEVDGEFLRKEGQKAVFRLVNVTGYDREVTLIPKQSQHFDLLVTGKIYPLGVLRVDPANGILEIKINGFTAKK